jgi:predicted alpha/beta-fold hydrolase
MQYAPFQPPFYLKPAYAQTMLASLKLRTWGNRRYLKQEKEMLLETAAGTRLLGYYTPQSGKRERGLAILLPGWEGSAHSTYMLSCGNHLYRNGLAVFRLNYRDHGDSHHLNKGLFYATLLDEVVEAVKQVSALSADSDLIIHRHGGHNGFLEGLFKPAWYDHLMVSLFTQ